MMGHWGMGFGWLGGIISLVVIFLVAWFVIRLINEAGNKGNTSDHFRAKDDPLDILKRRYARGEITREEFENMKKDLL